MTTQDTGPDELTAQQETWQRLRDANHIPHADSNCADIVMTLVLERIRLQRELAAARTEAKIWRARADGWQRCARELRDQAYALVAQRDDQLPAEHATPTEWSLGDPEPEWPTPMPMPMHVIGSRSSRIWTREHRHTGGTWLTQTPDEIRRETWEDLLEAESAVTRHD